MKWLKLWLFDIVLDACVAALRSQKPRHSAEFKAQVIFALERAERGLRAQADALLAQHDYNAEFPDADADRMLEAIQLIKNL